MSAYAKDINLVAAKDINTSAVCYNKLIKNTNTIITANGDTIKLSDNSFADGAQLILGVKNQQPKFCS